MNEVIQTEVKLGNDGRIFLIHRSVKTSSVVFSHTMTIDTADVLLSKLQECIIAYHAQHDQQLKDRGLNKTFDLKTGRSHA